MAEVAWGVVPTVLMERDEPVEAFLFPTFSDGPRRRGTWMPRSRRRRGASDAIGRRGKTTPGYYYFSSFYFACGWFLFVWQGTVGQIIILNPCLC